MYYFKDALHLKKPMGVLSIEGARVQTIKHDPSLAPRSNDDGDKKKKKKKKSEVGFGRRKGDDVPYEFVLRVVKPKPKEYYFRARSEREHMGWIASMTRSRMTGCRYENADGTVGVAGTLSATKATAAADGSRPAPYTSAVSSSSYGRGGGGGGASSSRSSVLKKEIDSQIDRNLDTISSMLGNLKEISINQANAIDVQNAKLDNMEVSVDAATTRIDRLNYKGRKILKR